MRTRQPCINKPNRRLRPKGITRRKKLDKFHVRSGWIQEWTSLKQFREKELLKIREIVRGPFSSPKLLRIQPFVVISSCYTANELKDLKPHETRRGIPDSWTEVLASSGICNSKENRIFQDKISCCVRCQITDALWNKLGVPLIQGIPDPFKQRFVSQRRSIERLQRRCGARKRMKEISRGTVRLVDHNQVNERNKERRTKKKERAEECRSTYTNKNDINGHEYHLQKGKDFVTAVEETSPVKSAENVKVKRDAKVRADANFKKTDETNPYKSSTRRKEKGNIRAKEYSAGERKNKHDVSASVRETSLGKRREGDSNTKTGTMKNLPVPTHRDTATKTRSLIQVQKPERTAMPTADKHKVKGRRDYISFHESTVREIPIEKLHGECTTKFFSTPYCSCPLCTSNRTTQNTKDFVELENQSKVLDVAKRVLCTSCENIYRYNASRGSDFTRRAVNLYPLDTVPRNLEKEAVSEGLYKRTKRKFCFCIQRAKEKIRVQNLSDRITEMPKKTGNTIVSWKELKLVCCQCDCPYLKIAPSNYAVTSEQRKRFRSRKQANKQRKERAEREHNHLNHIITNSLVQNRTNQVVGDSKNYCSARTASKTYIPKQGPEQVSPSTDIKSTRNVVGCKTTRRIKKNNNFGKIAANSTRISSVSPCDSIVMHEEVHSPEKTEYNEEVPKDSRHIAHIHFQDKTERESLFRDALENNCDRKILRDIYRADQTYFDRRKEKKIETNDTSDSDVGKKEVKYLQCSRSDKCIVYVESDSGDRADISNTSVDVNIYVTAHDTSPVTSTTLMHRLNRNTALLTHRNYLETPRKKDFKTYKKTCVICCAKRFPSDKTYERRKHRIIDRNECANFSTEDCDKFSRSVFDRNDGEEEAAGRPIRGDNDRDVEKLTLDATSLNVHHRDSTSLRAKQFFDGTSLQVGNKEAKKITVRSESAKTDTELFLSDTVISGAKRRIAISTQLDKEERKSPTSRYNVPEIPEAPTVYVDTRNRDDNEIKKTEFSSSNACFVKRMSHGGRDVFVADCTTDTTELPRTPGPCVARYDRAKCRNVRKISRGTNVLDKETTLDESDCFRIDNTPRSCRLEKCFHYSLLVEENRENCKKIPRENCKHYERILRSKSDNYLNSTKHRQKNVKQYINDTRELCKSEYSRDPERRTVTENLGGSISEKIIPSSGYTRLCDDQHFNCTKKYDKEFNRTANTRSRSNSEASS